MPSKTDEAIVQMKLALQYLHSMDRLNEGMTKEGLGFDIDGMREHLDKASRALDRAKQLDPQAVYVDEHKDGTIRWSVDKLAAHILFQEAKGYSSKAFNYPMFDYASSRGGIWETLVSKPRHDRKEEQHKRDSYTKALRAIERALEFDPKNPLYIKFHGESYHMLGNKEKAREIFDEGIRLYPDNLDLHRVKDHLST